MRALDWREIHLSEPVGERRRRKLRQWLLNPQRVVLAVLTVVLGLATWFWEPWR